MRLSISTVVASLYDSRKKSSYLELKQKRTQYAKLTHKVACLKAIQRQKLSMINSVCVMDDDTNDSDIADENLCLLLWCHVDDLENEIHELNNKLKQF